MTGGIIGMIGGLPSNYRDPTPVLEKFAEILMQAVLTWLDRRYPRYRSPDCGLKATEWTKSEASQNA